MDGDQCTLEHVIEQKKTHSLNVAGILPRAITLTTTPTNRSKGVIAPCVSKMSWYANVGDGDGGAVDMARQHCMMGCDSQFSGCGCL